MSLKINTQNRDIDIYNIMKNFTIRPKVIIENHCIGFEVHIGKYYYITLFV